MNSGFAMYYIKQIAFHSATCFAVYFINTKLVTILPPDWIYTIWSLLCIWILTDSYNIYQELKVLKASYDELFIRNRELDADYRNLLKSKHDQTNVLCETIADHTIMISDVRNRMLEWKSELSLINSKLTKSSASPYVKSSPSTVNSNSSTCSPITENKEIIVVPPLRQSSSMGNIYSMEILRDQNLHVKMKGRLNEFLGSKSCVF